MQTKICFMVLEIWYWDFGKVLEKLWKLKKFVRTLTFLYISTYFICSCIGCVCFAGNIAYALLS